jgi:hypothetical protein
VHVVTAPIDRPAALIIDGPRAVLVVREGLLDPDDLAYIDRLIEPVAVAEAS